MNVNTIEIMPVAQTFAPLSVARKTASAPVAEPKVPDQTQQDAGFFKKIAALFK